MLLITNVNNKTVSSSMDLSEIPLEVLENILSHLAEPATERFILQVKLLFLICQSESELVGWLLYQLSVEAEETCQSK